MQTTFEPEIDRRGFLRALVAAAASAVIVGGGAGLLQERLQQQALIRAVPAASALPDLPSVIEAAPGVGREMDLLARLAAAQAENVRLRAELDASRRDLVGLHGASSDASQTSQQLRVQLSEAQGRIGLLSGLVALYDQLDEIDVDEALEDGLAAVGSAVGELLDDVPSVAEGLALGQQALLELESHLPSLESGRRWLDDQARRVRLAYQGVESTLQAALETVSPALALLGDWFEKISKWLPFGILRSGAAVMQALTLLVAQTPDTLDGLETNIAGPLDVWLGREGEEAPLRRKVIKPLREQALGPAGAALGKAQQVETTFQTRLAQPAARATLRRQTVRQLIADYREQHQV